MGEKEKVKLVKIELSKAMLFIALSSLVFGLFFGMGFLFFLEMALEAFDINNIPIFGRVFLSLFLIPLTICFIFSFLGMITLLIINLILRIIKGIPLYFQEDNIPEIKKGSIEEPYKLP